MQKSKNSQHSSVPDGGDRGIRVALRRRRDIEKTVEKNPLTQTVIFRTTWYIFDSKTKMFTCLCMFMRPNVPDV